MLTLAFVGVDGGASASRNGVQSIKFTIAPVGENNPKPDIGCSGNVGTLSKDKMVFGASTGHRLAPPRSAFLPPWQ